MNFKKSVVASILMLSSMNINAYEVGAGYKFGTAGSGVDLSVAVTETINVRFTTTSYDFGSKSENFSISETGANATVATFNTTLSTDFGASGLLVDWYAFDGTFHLTAGMMKNDSSFNLNGNIVGNTVTFNGTPYNVTNDFVGGSSAISGNVKLGNAYEPYVGIGWGRKAGTEPGFSLSVELGVMMLTPSVNLVAPTLASGVTADQLKLDNDINEAEKSAAKELSSLELWPVVSVGVNYAF